MLPVDLCTGAKLLCPGPELLCTGGPELLRSGRDSWCRSTSRSR